MRRARFWRVPLACRAIAARGFLLPPRPSSSKVRVFDSHILITTTQSVRRIPRPCRKSSVRRAFARHATGRAVISPLQIAPSSNAGSNSSQFVHPSSSNTTDKAARSKMFSFEPLLFSTLLVASSAVTLRSTPRHLSQEQIAGFAPQTSVTDHVSHALFGCPQKKRFRDYMSGGRTYQVP